MGREPSKCSEYTDTTSNEPAPDVVAIVLSTVSISSLADAIREDDECDIDLPRVQVIKLVVTDG